ncbi:MAG TPA: hypothetical protein VHS78_10945 [Candidatus Elarobacter sp.]|jgi:hypothetical protein|nr:hypothetical protein [Candidatus Elarobacter sp.]
MVLSERDGSGAAGTRAKLADAGFDVEDSPYPEFIDRYFGRT